MKTIGVVIVTFNRLEKLKSALECFSKQKKKPEYVLIVDNASTDGTEEYLHQWKKIDEGFKKIVVVKEINSGGSGGFYTGLENAIMQDADWVWLSDDDAFPEPEALMYAEQYLDTFEDVSEISAICGTVINKGEIDFAHRRNIVKGILDIKDIPSTQLDYAKEAFEINAFSYVGAIINKEKLKKAGITNKDYFIWFDDTEHSLRLSKIGKIICVPKIRINHDTFDNDEKYTLSWKTYYGARNIIDIYKKYFPFKNFAFVCTGRIAKSYYRDLLNKNREFNKVARAGIRDGAKGKLGIHELYKPGWKPDDN